MDCETCGAPITPEVRRAGKCTYCSTAIVVSDAVLHRAAPAVDVADAIAAAFGGAGGIDPAAIVRAAFSSVSTLTTTATTFTFDGRTYSRVEDMPPEARAKLEKHRQALAKKGIKLP